MNAVDMNQYIDRLKLEKELKDFKGKILIAD